MMQPPLIHDAYVVLGIPFHGRGLFGIGAKAATQGRPYGCGAGAIPEGGISQPCFASHTSRTDMSDGDTPVMRDACPTDSGFCASSFWAASLLRLFISA